MNWGVLFVVTLYAILSLVWTVSVVNRYSKLLDEYTALRKISYWTALSEPQWQQRRNKTILLVFMPIISALALIHVFLLGNVDIITVIGYAIVCGAGTLVLLLMAFRDGSIYEPLGKFKELRGAWLPKISDED